MNSSFQESIISKICFAETVYTEKGRDDRRERIFRINIRGLEREGGGGEGGGRGGGGGERKKREVEAEKARIE